MDNSGYFWLSYYDRTISQVTSYQGEPSDNYDNNYQYDYLGLASAIQYMPGGEISIANVFTANTAEALRAVSAITSAPETTVTVKIYKLPSDAKGPLPENGGELVATVSKSLPTADIIRLNWILPDIWIKGINFLWWKLSGTVRGSIIILWRSERTTPERPPRRQSATQVRAIGCIRIILTVI